MKQRTCVTRNNILKGSLRYYFHIFEELFVINIVNEARIRTVQRAKNQLPVQRYSITEKVRIRHKGLPRSADTFMFSD